METEPKDVIVLGSIRRGKKKFSNIQNETKIQENKKKPKAQKKSKFQQRLEDMAKQRGYNPPKK